MEAPSTDREELERCQDALRRMEEEIELLRNAAVTFGELADRLNEQLHILRTQIVGPRSMRDPSSTEG